MPTLKINNQFAKSFENKTTGTQMTWWKTNFNMPVPNIFDNNSNFTQAEGMLNPIGLGTTFDLSGYNQGWEIIAAATIFIIDGEVTNPGGVLIKQTWKNPLGETMFTNSFNWNFSAQGPDTWQGYQIASNQGLAPWEVNQSGTYTLETSMSGDYNLSKTFNVTFTNVPAFTGYQTPGYLWVEGDNLKYTSANGFIHTLDGNIIGPTGTTGGNIWIDSLNNLHYVNDSGDDKIPLWRIEQFASAFSNGPTESVSGQSPGYLYADNQFGWTHLSYIGDDGKKYLIGDGHYPYTNPY